MTGRAASLLIVNYNSAELTRRAIQSARDSTTATSLQVVVVDNSDEHDVLLKTASADQVCSPGRNLGFGAGVNFGLEWCTGEVVIVANPDVVFNAGCIDQLVTTTVGDVAATGPRFTWDDAGRWFLPPTDDPTMFMKLSEALATRSRAWREARLRARTRQRIQFWRNTSTRRVRAISGAVMCLDRAALRSVGGFDERYHLYFEEVDLIRRFRQKNLSVVYHPAAVCRHLYNQSAGNESDSTARYLASERAYHQKWHGAAFIRMMGRIASAEPVAAAEYDAWSPGATIAVPEPFQNYMIEASPLPGFEVATGHFPSGGAVRFPPEVWDVYRGAVLFLRVIAIESVAVVARGRFDKTDKMADR